MALDLKKFFHFTSAQMLIMLDFTLQRKSPRLRCKRLEKTPKRVFSVLMSGRMTYTSGETNLSLNGQQWK